jgi:capsule polysaccharide export protein KpsC/LpsZ
VQFHRITRSRRGRRVALASLIAGALLLAPTAAFANAARLTRVSNVPLA